MKVIKIYPQGFASNSYCLTADGKSAVLIDCAQPRVLEECKKLNLTPEYVLLTHGHFDHVGGCSSASHAGAKICCAEAEQNLLFGYGSLCSQYGVSLNGVKIYRTFYGGEKFELCGMNFTVVSTPGHTEGSVCYIVQDKIFSGDTLFLESVGRSDLPTGSANKLIQSVKKIFKLNGDYTVYCGHGDDTTLNHERRFNPYVRI